MRKRKVRAKDMRALTEEVLEEAQSVLEESAVARLSDKEMTDDAGSK